MEGEEMEHERPLEDLTIKELKEMALAMGGISGVTAMKKTELIIAIKKAKGLPVKETREKPIETVIELKHRMRELRAQRDSLRKRADKEKMRLLTKKISRLKKRTRRLAEKTA
jgi:hypothetical protein